MIQGSNDPEYVRRQYENECGLRARKAIYGAVGGMDARDVAFDAVRGVAPRRVLEVGCGEGEFSERLDAELGVEIVALDQSARMVELAAARGVDARVGDVQELPFADESFDVAVAAWMLYHVPDLDRALAELARVLVRGGRLVAVTNREHHLEEMFRLVGVERWELPFGAENGAELLSRHFDTGRASRRDRDGDVCRRGADPRVSPLVRTSCGVRAGGTRPRRAARRAPSPCRLRRRQGAVISAAELIQRKRDGDELSSDELADLVLGYTRGEIPDYQMAAFLMAVYFRGLSALETFALTDAMIRSGETLELGAALGRKVVDKHSTGRCRRQDLDRRRSDRRRLRRAVREDERPGARAHGRDAGQARVDSRLPCRAVDRRVRLPGARRRHGDRRADCRSRPGRQAALRAS